MTQKIDLGGGEFITAKEAASLTGYTSDYVGQLCRGGKLQAKMIGRTWFVLKDSIVNHGNLTVTQNSPKKVHLRHESKISKVELGPVLKFVDVQKKARTHQSNLTYEKDDSPLRPSLRKRGENNKINSLSDLAERKKAKSLFPARVRPRNYLYGFDPAKVNPELVNKIGAFVLSASMVFGTFFVVNSNYFQYIQYNFFSRIESSAQFAADIISEVPDSTLKLANKTPVYLNSGAISVYEEIQTVSNLFGDAIYSVADSSRNVLVQLNQSPKEMFASVVSNYSDILSVSLSSNVLNLFSSVKKRIDYLAKNVYVSINHLIYKQASSFVILVDKIFNQPLAHVGQYASGITMIDDSTGMTYCFTMVKGQPKSSPGSCH